MIPVVLEQRPAVFDLKIGIKIVGRLTCYKHGCISASWWEDSTGKFHWIDNFRNTRIASLAILRMHHFISHSGTSGLGKIPLERIKGIR